MLDTTPIAGPLAEREHEGPTAQAGGAATSRAARSAASVLLFVGACLVFLPYSLHAATPTAWRLPIWGSITLLFLAAVVWTGRREVADGVRVAVYGLFVASAAWLADWFLSGWLIVLTGVPQESPVGYTLAKVESTVVLVLVVLALVRLRGEGLASLYVRRGKARWWLPIGLVAFGFLAVTAFYAAEEMFRGEAMTVARVRPWLPWLLLFVFSNAFSEELVFRGLLLPRFEPLIGAVPAIIVTSVAFSLAHVGVTYTPQLLVFLGMTLVLGLIWGTLIRRTDSIWGAVLFHAGADLPVLIGIWSTM